MPTPTERGDQLETAVHWIERTILDEVLEFSDESYTIELKKRIRVEEVRHEIDIYIEVDLGTGYTSTFIFECKNWAKKVGKNEIIVFSKKIDLVSAQKGFFVAKSLTRDAIAQAKTDSRFILIHATEVDTTVLNVEDILGDVSMVGFSHDDPKLSVHVIQRSLPGGIERVSSLENSINVSLRGEEMTLRECIKEPLDRMWKTLRDHAFQDDSWLEKCDYTAEQELEFDPGDLMLNGRDIGMVKIKVSLTCRREILLPVISAAFDIEGRGRAIVMKHERDGKTFMEITSVQRDISPAED